MVWWLLFHAPLCGYSADRKQAWNGSNLCVDGIYKRVQKGEHMPHYPYLIIGGGMAAAAAIEGIREVDGEKEIGVIAAESHQPYDRPPLSKALWKGEASVEDIFRASGDAVTFHNERIAIQLEPDAHRVVDDHDRTYTYDRLLLATGAAPRRLPFGGDHIIYFRTLDTYRQLRQYAEKYEKFAVIGGGFIGSELAAALKLHDKLVTMIFPQSAICSKIFPADIATFLNEYYRQKRVEVWAGEEVQNVEGRGTDLTVVTASDRRLKVDAVVAGIGVTPNTELAESAGLEVGDGVVVNQMLQTSHPDIYAAGDMANFHDQVLDQRRRVEHEDAANSMGKAAGRAMSGEGEPYAYSPMFYSDLFDLGYEAVGELDARLETVADWQNEYETGVIYYLKNRRVRGVLLWNVWGQVDAARDLIVAGKEFSPQELEGAIKA